MDYRTAERLNAVIRSVSMRHRAAATALLAELGLSIGQEILLLELDIHGPRTQAQLAAGAGCEPPTITMSVRKLEAAGLVVRAASPTDRRAVIVELSDQGKDLIPALKSQWTRLAELTVAGLDPGSLDVLLEVLPDLAQSLGRLGKRVAALPDSVEEAADGHGQPDRQQCAVGELYDSGVAKHRDEVATFSTTRDRADHPPRKRDRDQYQQGAGANGDGDQRHDQCAIDEPGEDRP